MVFVLVYTEIHLKGNETNNEAINSSISEDNDLAYQSTITALKTMRYFFLPISCILYFVFFFTLKTMRY